MVMLAGVNKMLKIYAAITTGVFKYIGHGNSAISPNPYLTTLGGAEDGTRLDCTSAGFQDVKGVSLRLFAAYASTVATTTIRTVGLFDASTTGIMLALHNFGSLAFVHTANSDAFSLGMILDFVPFGDV
jgi:glycine cleavage system protein P-like pyridoxal-binding family